MRTMYLKPKDISWVDLCKYFEQHIYDENKTPEEEDKLFRYLFCLCHMLAVKKRWFNSEDDYDNFAMYCTGEIYLRIVDNRIGHTNAEGKKVSKLKKDRPLIKLRNLLDYVKKTLKYLRMTYRNDAYNFTTDESKYDTLKLEANYRELIRLSSRRDCSDEIISEIEQLSNIINDVLNTTYYKNNKIMKRKLYTSCVLSLLNAYTLSNDAKEYMSSDKFKSKRTDFKEAFIENEYEKELQNCVICWLLPESMSDYIYILLSEIREKLSKNLNVIISDNDIPDNILDDIITQTTAEIYAGTQTEDGKSTNQLEE